MQREWSPVLDKENQNQNKITNINKHEWLKGYYHIADHIDYAWWWKKGEREWTGNTQYEAEYVI